MCAAMKYVSLVVCWVCDYLCLIFLFKETNFESSVNTLS